MLEGDAAAKASIRAQGQRVTALASRSDYARSDQLVELAGPAWPVRGWRNKLGNYPPMGSNYYALPRFYSANVPAKVVLQFAYASLHVLHYSYM